MRCDGCAHWLTRTVTTYDDGSEIEKQLAPEGKGHCGTLDMDTLPEFGCVHFILGDVHEVRAHKVGKPWQHHHGGPCPDCSGRGSSLPIPDRNGFVPASACRRCAGTGMVRYYDDGYIGEEQTRLHPKERLAKDKAVKPRCVHCGKEAKSDWLVCPWCGIKYFELPSKTEVIEESLGAAQ